MPIKIIDNKKVDITEDEWTMYRQIVASYTNPPYQKGEDYFIDLFETNDAGVIIYLKPPSQRQVSIEIFLFMVSIMNHQHLRAMYTQIDNLSKQINIKIEQEVNRKLEEIKNNKEI
jgi:hypothetical protein